MQRLQFFTTTLGLIAILVVAGCEQHPSVVQSFQKGPSFGVPESSSSYKDQYGKLYSGQLEIRDGKVNGRGTMVQPDGIKFSGEFRDGNPVNGTVELPSGDKYFGELRNGKRSGTGTYVWASGNKFTGEFRDDKPFGPGDVTFANGRQSKAEFRDGKFVEVQQEQVSASSPASEQARSAPVSTLICVNPVFTEEQRLKREAASTPTKASETEEAVRYLHQKYCREVNAGAELQLSQKVALGGGCFQYSGQYRGEKVYWGACG